MPNLSDIIEIRLTQRLTFNGNYKPIEAGRRFRALVNQVEPLEVIIWIAHEEVFLDADQFEIVTA